MNLVLHYDLRNRARLFNIVSSQDDFKGGTNLINIEIAGWVGIITILFIILCFTFTLSFIENVQKEDERITKQSKTAAIICLSVALLTPILYILFK